MCSSTTMRPSRVSRPAASASLMSGRTPVAATTMSQSIVVSSSKSTRAVVDRLHGRPADEANIVVGQYLCHPLTGLESEPPVERNGFRGDERGRDSAGGKASGGLAADQTSADDDGRFGVAGGHLQRDGIGERPQAQGGLTAGHIERDGHRTRRDQ